MSSPLRVLGLLSVVVWLAAGCGASDSRSCKFKSDCAGSQVCTMGTCGDGCHVSADCPTGQSCVTAADKTKVCQLPIENQCAVSSDCQVPLICAVDQRCRNQCQVSVDCPSGQICSTTQTCAAPSEVDVNNNLAVGGSGGTGGGAGAPSGAGGNKLDVGGACLLSSDCNEPLVCTLGKCHVVCMNSADCPAGQSCIVVGDLAVCQLPTETDCAYSSDCPTLLICAADQRCRNQCQVSVDCRPRQICTTSKVCAEPSQVDANNNLIVRDGGVTGSAGAGGSTGG